jgi:predicted transposase/invertase (TIGR01784 family)
MRYTRSHITKWEILTMRFLDVKTDFAFKKVFGSERSKPLLISFLNALLEYEGEHTITDLTIIDPYQAPVIKGMKDTYVDVKAVLANGNTVIIEMQVLNVEGFEKRILYNAAKAYAAQLGRGEDYTLLNPVIALTFTDFIMFREQAEAVSRYKLLETQTLAQYSDDVELIFIELPKFKITLEALEGIHDKWIYFVKHAGRLDYVPATLMMEPCINEAFGIANKAGLTEAELEAQEKRHDFIRLQRGSIEKALHDGQARGRAEGLAEGLAEGKAQGANDKALAIARNLLDVLDDETIAQKTGLDVLQIARLR